MKNGGGEIFLFLIYLSVIPLPSPATHPTGAEMVLVWRSHLGLSFFVHAVYV